MITFIVTFIITLFVAAWLYFCISCILFDDETCNEVENDGVNRIPAPPEGHDPNDTSYLVGYCLHCERWNGNRLFCKYCGYPIYDE